MNNPFTWTFGREPINRIDRLEQKDYVVNSFESNPPSLYRAPKIERQPLNISMIATRYQAIFNLTDEDARNMAKETRGYSFAFQVLGYLTWNANASWRTVLPEYRQYLEEFVYNKI